MEVMVTGAEVLGGTATTPAFFQMTGPRPARSARAGVGMLACVDDSAASDRILDQALAVARGLELSVAAARVLEAPRHLSAPADPLEWQARRRDGLDRLERLVGASGRVRSRIERLLLAGPAADELDGWARANRVGMMALGTHERGDDESGLGGTAQRVMESAAASLLLVPIAGQGRLPYRRLLVPLDGSCRAESVLPVAVRLARDNCAELVLAHVVPRSESIDSGAGDGPAHVLRLRLAKQNEQGARDYLDGLAARLWKERLPVRAIVAADSDPRTELRRLAVELHADLIVVSSHGRSGMTDVPCGSVTDYLANHAPAPLLIVRPNFAHDFAGSSTPVEHGARSPSPEQI